MSDTTNTVPSRRKFLQWATVIAYPSVPSMLLNACGAGGDGVGSILGDVTLTTTSTTQASEINPTSLTITAKPVKAVYVPGKIPTAVNAWSFVNTAKVTAATPLLSTHFGPTIEVRRKAPLSVTWANAIPASATGSSYLANPPFPILPYNGLCGSVAAQSPVGINVHLHGAKVNGVYDGWPLSPVGYANNPYKFPTSSKYVYPNDQRAACLWYHDHSLDNTAQNVYAGLAGLYIVRDTFDDALMALIGGSKQEKFMAVNDRVLTPDSLAVDYQGGRVMDTTVYQAPRVEFLGESLFVNGNPASAAASTVDRRVLRLRFLNAANARTFSFALFDPAAVTAGTGRVWYSDAMTIIGSDQGFTGTAVPLAATDYVTMSSGQRLDLLIDFSKIPSTVKSLKIANLAINFRLPQFATVPPTPEALFTSYADSICSPTSVNYTATDSALYTALKTDPVSTLTTFTLNANTAAQIAAFKVPTLAQINAVLLGACLDFDFLWTGSKLGTLPGVKFGPNRLVLPISNIEGFGGPSVVNGVTVNDYGNGLAGWSDVQIFELVDGSVTPDADNGYWQLPINVDLKTTVNPLPGDVTNGSQVNYTIARRSFLQTRSNPDITVTKKYPALHTPTIVAKANTYERWYVANLPNSQPLTSLNGAPDMHPFHIHIVNIVVTRRWELVNGQFVPLPADPKKLDLVARQDTVTIPSNQLVELLVHYPPGYTGDYVYHCHLIEHEDACMMSSLRVTL
jgi:FtsP/CotA-like multicopper oxidase with cupredoxin domain